MARKPYPRRQFPNWAKLDPSIDRLLAEGWNVADIAKDLGLKPDTVRAHLRTREVSGTPQGTHQVPIEIDIRANEPTGTQEVPDTEPIGSLEGTHQVLHNSEEPIGTHEVLDKSSEPVSTYEVPMLASEPAGTLEGTDPSADLHRFSTAHHELLLAMSTQLDRQGIALSALLERVSTLEAEAVTYRRYLQPVPVKEASRLMRFLPEWMRNLQGIPGYPQHPDRDSRLNIHLPEEERWLLNAMAEGLEENISRMIRRILTEWCHGEEAQKGVRTYLERRGIQEGTSQGTDEP